MPQVRRQTRAQGTRPDFCIRNGIPLGNCASTESGLPEVLSSSTLSSSLLLLSSLPSRKREHEKGEMAREEKSHLGVELGKTQFRWARGHPRRAGCPRW